MCHTVNLPSSTVQDNNNMGAFGKCMRITPQRVNFDFHHHVFNAHDLYRNIVQTRRRVTAVDGRQAAVQNPLRAYYEFKMNTLKTHCIRFNVGLNCLLAIVCNNIIIARRFIPDSPTSNEGSIKNSQFADISCYFMAFITSNNIFHSYNLLRCIMVSCLKSIVLFIN